MPLYDSTALTDAAIADFHAGYRPRFSIGEIVTPLHHHGVYRIEFLFPNGMILGRDTRTGQAWPFSPEAIRKVETKPVDVEYRVRETRGPGYGDAPCLGSGRATLL